MTKGGGRGGQNLKKLMASFMKGPIAHVTWLYLLIQIHAISVEVLLRKAWNSQCNIIYDNFCK